MTKFKTGPKWLLPLELSPPYRAFRLGNARVHVLAEGSYTVDPEGPFGKQGLLGPGKEAEAARAKHLRADGCLADPMMFAAMLVQVDGVNVLLDACLGEVEVPAQFCKEDGRPPYNLLKVMERYAKIKPDEIDFVIHSHLHPDHIGWNVRHPPEGFDGEPVPTFPNAKHVLQRSEWDYPAKHFACPWRESWDVKCSPLYFKGMVQLVDGDVELLPSVSLVRTVGHTPGHQCVRIASGGEVAFYVGDALHFVPQVTWPELCPIFDCCRWSAAKASRLGRPQLKEDASVVARRALLRRIHTEDAVILSPHLPFPGIGRLGNVEEKRFCWESVVAEKPAQPPRNSCFAWCCHA